VDGVITHGGLADIDPQDIATMEVVKGAAAASLYGSRAQAGVIQITTKRGSAVSAGRTQVTFRQNYNLHNIERFNGTAMSHPYRLMADGSAFMGFNGLPVVLPALTGAFPLDDKGNGSDSFRSFSDKPYPAPTWDPWKQTYQNGSNYSTYVSVGGNGGNTQYQVSGNYVRDKGNMALLTGLTQKNFRLNVDHQVGDLRMALSTYLTRSEGDDILEGGTGANRFGFDPFLNLGFLSPKSNLTNTDASGKIDILGDQVGWGVNPLYRLSREHHTKNNQRFMGGLDLNYAPLSWLGFESNVSYDRSDLTQQHYQPPGLLSSAQPQPAVPDRLSRHGEHDHRGRQRQRHRKRHRKDRRPDRASPSSLAGGEQGLQPAHAQGSSLLVADVPRLSLATSGITNDLTAQTVRSEGLFLVNTLTYKDRYVLDVLGRRDGSSLFGADERWQNYYRVALAWRMASEPWWPFEIIDDFKPRFSRGTAGGRPQFDAQYQTYFVGVGSISPGVSGQLQAEAGARHRERVRLRRVDRAPLHGARRTT
jgi:TonB-dependent SusC/RagA subfamily outer membrane receptor